MDVDVGSMRRCDRGERKVRFQTFARVLDDGGLGDRRELGDPARNTIAGELGATRDPRENRI